MKEKRALLRAILLLPKETIAFLLALYEDADLQSILRSKVKGEQVRRQNTFQKKMEKRTAELLQEAPHLRLKLLLALNEGFELLPRKYDIKRDVSENCDMLIAAFIMQFNKLYPLAPITTVQEGLNYYLNQTAYLAQKRFSELSTAEQSEAVDAFCGYLEDLTASNIAKIKQAIGIKQLNNAEINRSMSTGRFWLALAEVEQKCGFSIFAGCISIITASSGMVGLPLVFGGSTQVLSLVEVLANPLFISGLVVDRKKAKSYKKEIPLLVFIHLLLQIVDYQTEEDDDEAAEEILKLWQQNWLLVENLRAKEQDTYAALDLANAGLKSFNQGLKNCSELGRLVVERKEQLIAGLRQRILDTPEELSFGEWGEFFSFYGKRIVDERKKKEALENKDRDHSALQRILSVNSGRDKAGIEKNILDTANECVHIARSKWENGLRTFSTEVSAQMSEWDKINNELNRALQEDKKLHLEIDEMSRVINEKKTELVRLRKLRKQAEEKFWGMDKLE